MLYAERIKKHYNAVDRIFYDAIKKTAPSFLSVWLKAHRLSGRHMNKITFSNSSVAFPAPDFNRASVSESR